MVYIIKGGPGRRQDGKNPRAATLKPNQKAGGLYNCKKQYMLKNDGSRAKKKKAERRVVDISIDPRYSQPEI